MDTLLMALRELKLSAMVQALETQRELPGSYGELGFEERLSLMVEVENLHRKNNHICRMRRQSQMRLQAKPEDIRYIPSRGVTPEQMRDLLGGQYLKYQKSILITGPTGTGKTWLSCALGEQACRQQYSVRYWRVGRLLAHLHQCQVDGTYLKQLKQLEKIELLILNDVGLESISPMQATMLLEVMEDRYDKSSSILISQLPVKKWYGLIENPTTADALLDRLVHPSYRLELKGESLRKEQGVASTGKID
ncbi:Helper of transposition ISSoEn3, IS21 family [Candidatus Sodalis pierantonius str. SOPE]|uniref:Helper of transposition ISSoEn3, IS21 family n=1 Tax=Candidatus Sodalis pierantonii str. SOPE TaxID=2342 RepID=W0HGU3_9GAMM|nr:IS21-like element ISSoEn3 family helper ATPase IstB [Candidatus Sodalis pierantonius]AHF72941.1 Helper of transposition ISSoEn3, IS21 family [Candidatus Sodalis pierantonius str. SOPE]